jgi:hypothetical protein
MTHCRDNRQVCKWTVNCKKRIDQSDGADGERIHSSSTRNVGTEMDCQIPGLTRVNTSRLPFIHSTAIDPLRSNKREPNDKRIRGDRREVQSSARLYTDTQVEWGSKNLKGHTQLGALVTCMHSTRRCILFQQVHLRSVLRVADLIKRIIERRVAANWNTTEMYSRCMLTLHGSPASHACMRIIQRFDPENELVRIFDWPYGRGRKAPNYYIVNKRSSTPRWYDGWSIPSPTHKGISQTDRTYVTGWRVVIFVQRKHKMALVQTGLYGTPMQ